MKRNYNIGLIGFGSIGERHFQNIEKVLREKGITYSIDLIRSSRSKKIDTNIEGRVRNVFYSHKDAPNNYDVIFITNPTHLHFETIKCFSQKTKHMFIEKPVFDKIDINIKELALKKDSIYYVACPIRYTNVIQYLKKHCNLEKVYCARVICSSYLPEWRPHIDYRSTYSAKKEQGGGVSIDLIHEWDYLSYLFAQPSKIFNIRGKFSELEINSDDLSIYIAQYKNMAVEVHLDYFGRKPIREIQLFTAEDTIIGDLLNSEIRFLKSGKVEKFKESRNDFQLKEIQYFFNLLEGKEQNTNDIYAALNTLKIAKEGIL